jgi:hypothetical protein
MNSASNLIEIRRCRALLGSCPGPQGPQGPPGPTGPTGPEGPGVSPLYASFFSITTQNATITNPVAITYSGRSIGSIDVSGTYPNSIIVIPVAGVYKILFSAQCDVSSGTHYLEIFPVVNGTSVPDSNTRIRLNNATEACLVVEYFLSFNANDKLQLFMIGDSTNVRLLAIPRGGPPTDPDIPDIPSIIVTIMRIA